MKGAEVVMVGGGGGAERGSQEKEKEEGVFFFLKKSEIVALNTSLQKNRELIQKAVLWAPCQRFQFSKCQVEPSSYLHFSNG